MAKQVGIEELLKKNGSKHWNQLRKEGKVGLDHTGATFPELFSANADFSGLTLIGSEWEKCDLSKVSFKETDLSNAYFHGGRLQDCDFRGAKLDGATFEKLKLLRSLGGLAAPGRADSLEAVLPIPTGRQPYAPPVTLPPEPKPMVPWDSAELAPLPPSEPTLPRVVS